MQGTFQCCDENHVYLKSNGKRIKVGYDKLSIESLKFIESSGKILVGQDAEGNQKVAIVDLKDREKLYEIEIELKVCAERKKKLQKWVAEDKRELRELNRRAKAAGLAMVKADQSLLEAVSYTHLTLPTILLV